MVASGPSGTFHDLGWSMRYEVPGSCGARSGPGPEGETIGETLTARRRDPRADWPPPRTLSERPPSLLEWEPRSLTTDSWGAVAAGCSCRRLGRRRVRRPPHAACSCHLDGRSSRPVPSTLSSVAV